MASFPDIPADKPTENQRELTIFLILFCIAVLPYLNTLFNDFVYDDHFQVVGNPYAHSFHYLPQIFTTTVWSFQGAQGLTNYFRPMMTLGYLLTYRIAGAISFSFHLLNIILHGIAVLFVFCLVRRFSGERPALIAAGLFALHPIHTESVAWIAAVTDLELTVFYLATFLLYLKIPGATRGYRARILMCSVFVFALLSKEQAMTLPVLALIFEHVYRDDRLTTTLRQKISRYGPLWVIAALYFAARTIVVGGVTSVVLRPNLSMQETLLSAIALIGSYLGKLLWPARLSAFYIFHASEHLTDAPVLVGLAGLIVSAILFAILWKRARIISFSLIWIFLTLAPVLNARWMPAAVFGERYLYLPSVGFCWLFGWGVAKLWPVKSLASARPSLRFMYALLAALGILCVSKIVIQNRVWRTDETLYSHVLETQPDAPYMISNLGGVYFDRGDLEKAEHEWLLALSLGAKNANALDNMALLRQRQHRYDESLDYSRRALSVNPVYTVEHVHLAETLALVGRDAEAEWQYRIATALSPLSIRARNAYGKFLFDARRLDEARAEYELSAAADSSSEACDRLGDVYLITNKIPRAEKMFRQAVGLDPFDSHAHIGLGQVLESEGHSADALHEYRTGLETNPIDPIAKAGVSRLSENVPARSSPQ